MGRVITSSKLTKNAVLSKISQISIFSLYFNIDATVIQHCIDTGELIKSPIRNDRHPTCGFRYDNKGKLKFKDFAGYFWGDCFDAAAKIIAVIYNREININNKSDFIFVLKHITLSFRDVFYGVEKDPNYNTQIHKSINIIKNKKPIIEIVTRTWNENDIKYWNKFGIDIKLLNVYFIYPVEQYFIDKKANPYPKYFYNDKDPCYAYYLGKDSDGIDDIKLYFPYREKTGIRFITNSNCIEGSYTLFKSNYDIIVITKSTKDRLSIIAHILKMSKLYTEIKNLTIGVVNIPHETYRLKGFEYDWLKSKLSKEGTLLTLMDNDTTGINQAKWLNDTYNIPYVFIPTRYKNKDFAELKEHNKFEEVCKLIFITLKYIENERDKCNRQFETDSIMPF